MGKYLAFLVALIGAEAVYATSDPLPICLIDNLNVCAGELVGSQGIIYDGDDATDCTTGGGSEYVVCTKTPSGWIAAGGGAGGTPGGSDTQVQFNDGGAFGGKAGFTFDKATDLLVVPGNISITGALSGIQFEGGASPGKYAIASAVGDPASGTVSALLDQITTSGYLVTNNSTQTLTNKTLDAASNVIAADTAIALASDPANCASDTYPLGVDASGAVEGCATVPSAGITNGTIVNEDVNDSADIAATKLAYAGGDTVGAGTVEAAIDELSTEKADASDILTSSQVFRADAATSWTSGAVTASDGTLLDMSAINASGTSEGLKLPQATSCTSATAQGQTCWDTTHKMLFVGDGTTALPAGMEVLYFYYYNATSVTTTLFGSDDLLGIYASSTSTRNTSQALRYVESLYQLGATGAQAFVHKIQCNLAPIGSSTWTNGSDSVALQVVEMDAASATAMTTIGSPATLSGTVTVAPNPFVEGNVVSSTINAFTTLTGGAHYIGINPVLTDADNGVVGLAIQCSVWLKRTI